LQNLVILDVVILLLWFIMMGGGLEGAFGGQAIFFSHALYFLV
jgi:hypothetical protein